MQCPGFPQFLVHGALMLFDDRLKKIGVESATGRARTCRANRGRTKTCATKIILTRYEKLKPAGG
jgi:hypothetical protein